jgi:hypothetical protein
MISVLLRPGPKVSMRTPLLSLVCVAVMGQPMALAHFVIESRTGGLG